MSEYTPTTVEVREAYAEYVDSADFPTERAFEEHLAGGGGEGEFDRWLARHDAEVREQVARDVSTYLPIMLRDEATDGCGWLSDMDGVWLDHGTDVSTPSGSIDVDQIGEYAARIARGGESE